MQILLAEDNPHLSQLTKRSLIEDGFMVDLAVNGQETIDKFEINEYDLVILDVMMPELTGFEVAKHIRHSDMTIPIIFLTALGDIDDKTIGFLTGGDDYLVKPFSYEELTLRVKALLRRGKRAEKIVLESGELSLDTYAKTANYNNKPLNLTAKELGLLEYLLANKGRVIPKTELLEHVWDMNYIGFSNVVETYIRYLRAKIRGTGESNEVIITARGLGYWIKDTP